MDKVGIIGFGNMGSAFAMGLKAMGISVAVAEQKPEAVREATGQTPGLPPGQPGEDRPEEIVPLRGGLEELMGLLDAWTR